MASIVRTAAIAFGAYVASRVYPPLSRAVTVFGLWNGRPNTILAANEIKSIPGTLQCEDLHYFAPSQELFTACQLDRKERFSWFPPLAVFTDPSAASRGSLQVVDPKTFKTRHLELEGFSGVFSTHGIDIIQDVDDPTIAHIFAVNHVPNPACTSHCGGQSKELASIEVFRHEIGSSKARHVTTVRHPLIRLPNDILAIDSKTFYVTNDHKYPEGPLRIIEDVVVAANWSDTVRVSFGEVPSKGGESKVDANVALTGLPNNNGLGHGRQKSPAASKELWIGCAAHGLLHRAQVSDSQNLTILEEIELDSCIDNPSYFVDPYAESTGDDASGVFLGGFAKGYLVALHVESPDAKDPVTVWHVKKDDKGRGGNWRKKAIFQDDGGRIRSASAAVVVAIDPKLENGKKMGWLFVTGLWSENIIAVKVDLGW